MDIGRGPATLETYMLVTAMVDERATSDLISEEMRQRMVVGSAELTVR